MKKKTYKTLAGLLRANGAQQFTMSDFLSGEIYKRRYGEYVKFELTDSALRELSDGFCQALGFLSDIAYRLEGQRVTA